MDCVVSVQRTSSSTKLVLKYGNGKDVYVFKYKTDKIRCKISNTCHQKLSIKLA